MKKKRKLKTRTTNTTNTKGCGGYGRDGVLVVGRFSLRDTRARRQESSSSSSSSKTKIQLKKMGQKKGGLLSSLRDRRRRRKEEEEEEEKEKERDDINVPIFGGKPRIFEQRGGFDGIRKLLLSEEEKDKKHQREQKLTTKEEEEDKGKEAEKKDDDSDVNTTNTNDDENHSDVFIAYEKHLTKSQQHQARLRRQSEASANAYRPGLRNRGEDLLPITAQKAKEMEFREAEWLKLYPVPVTRFTEKRSNDGHRRPAVILESIISKDYKRIKTESRFKRLTRLVEGINVARWGFEGIEDEEEVRITKEFYDLSQYYETKKSRKEKKRRLKELERKKRREEKRRNFVPKTIVPRRLAAVMDFRKPKARTHPIRFLKKDTNEEKEEEEEEEEEGVQMQAEAVSSPSYSFTDVLDTIHDWVGSNLLNLRETCQNINARKQEHIMDHIDAISTMHMPKAISAQKDIYRDFLRSLDVSVVPAHGTIKMYQNLFADAKRRVQNLVSDTKVRDEWFLTGSTNLRRGRVQQQKQVEVTLPCEDEDDDDDHERCIVRTLVKEAIERVVESSEALVHRITPFPRTELATNASDLIWDASTFESYAKRTSLSPSFPTAAVAVVVKPKVTWLAKSKRSGPRTPGERGWFRSGNAFENGSQDAQQRWRHPNPEIESRPRESYDDYFSSDSSTSSSESDSEDIFFRDVQRKRAPPPPLAQQQSKKKNVIPKIWKGRQLAIQKFGHDEKRMWRDKIGEFLRKSRKTLGHRPLDVSWGGSVLDSVIGANLTQNVTDVLSSTAMLNLMAKFPVTEETQSKHLERVERAVRVKDLVKNVINSVVEKDRERYEKECAQAASEVVRNAIDRIVSRETGRDNIAQEEDVEMRDALDIETEMGAAAVAEVIERMQIDDKDDIEQPSFFLCRGVPKIDSSSFGLDRTSLDENTDLHESSVIVELPVMSPLEQLYYSERQMWNDFSKTPLTKRRFSEKEAWIECSNEDCGKWRRIPKALADSLLTHNTTSENVEAADYLNWTCSRSFDKRHNGCDKPQEMLNDDIDEIVREAEILRKEDEEQKAKEKKMRENKAKLREEREASKQQAASRAELNRRERRAKTDKLKALAQAARDRQDFICDNDPTENEIIVRDCVDWHRVLHEASIDDIIECIRCRGMHSMLAHRIKKILRRVLDERGVLSLEFLREASTEEANAYLNEIEGMGAKTSACVNLLSLENRDFPVDVNVGRIMARLGWVPLEDDFKLELLEQYAPEESVYEFLSERLNMFDVTMLYELHYHMITLGKVFCAKRDPNCASCPMNSDCEYAKCGGKRRNNKMNNVGVYTPAPNVNNAEPPTPPKEVVTIDLTKEQTRTQPIEDIEDIGLASPSEGSSPKMPLTPTATNNNVIGKRFPSNSSIESPSSLDGFNSPTESSDNLAADVLTVEEFVERAKAQKHQQQNEKDFSEATAASVEDASPLHVEPSHTAPLAPFSLQNDAFANNVAETMDSIVAAGQIWTDLGKPAGKKAMRVLLLLSSEDDSDDDNVEENKSAVAAMIMRRFKSLSKICHPDKNRNDLERASAAFGILAEAKTKAMEAVAEVDERALKDDAAFESEAEDEVLREVGDPRFAKFNAATAAKTTTAEEEEEAFLTPNRHNQLADLSSFTKAQFRSEVQGWRVPDECVPAELLHSLSPHPTSIIGECDATRRYCVIAAPREASDFERVYKISTSSEEEHEQNNHDNDENDDDIVMEDAKTNISKENDEEDIIITTPPPPPAPSHLSPPSEPSSIKCVFFVTALCACKRSFPLHGTYFQVNEVFLDLRSAAKPVSVDIETLKTSPKIVTLLGASIGSVTRGMTRTEVTRLFNHQVLCVRAWERRTGYPRELPKWICPVVPVASTGQEFTEFDFPSPLLHPEKSAAAMASKAPKLGRPKKKRPAETISIAINREPTPPETPFNNGIFRSYLKRKSVEKEQQKNNNRASAKKTKKSEKDGDGNNNEQKRAKKKFTFPIIRSSQKCGKCKTCLNPQMRKACLTRRAEMTTTGGMKRHESSSPLSSPLAAPPSTPVTAMIATTIDAFVIRSKDYEIVD